MLPINMSKKKKRKKRFFFQYFLSWLIFDTSRSVWADMYTAVEREAKDEKHLYVFL